MLKHIFRELNLGGGTNPPPKKKILGPEPRILGGFAPLLTGSPLTLGVGDGAGTAPEFCLLKLAKILPPPYSEMDGPCDFF